MFGPELSPALSVDDLELGERVRATLDDVRYVPRAIPGHVGRLTITDRNLRFAETTRAAGEMLHGFPSVRDLLRGGLRLEIPRADVASVTTSRSMGLFSVLRVTLRSGRELAFHVGLRGLAPIVSALSPSAR